MTSTFLVVIYFQLNKRKLTFLASQIKEQSKIDGNGIEVLLDELTDRQREVYELIIAGKTNKEIKSELFIEQKHFENPH